MSAKLASNSAVVELSINSASETSRSEIVCFGAALIAGIRSSSESELSMFYEGLSASLQINARSQIKVGN